MRLEIEKQVDARLAVARKQSEHHKRQLRTLQDEQQKLIQLHYRNLVSEEVLQAEQQRIETERAQTRQWVESATHEAAEVLEAVNDALALVDRCHETYLAAEPHVRRLMNQAIFERLLVSTDDTPGDQHPVFARIARIRQTGRPTAPVGAGSPRKARTPGFPGVLVPTSSKWCSQRDLNPASDWS
jgi:hypothetical protein